MLHPAIIAAFHAGPDLYSTDTHTRTHVCTGNQFVISQEGSVVGDPWPSHCLALQPLLLLPGHHPIISLHSCLICALVIEYRVGSLVHLIIEYNLLLQSCCCSIHVAHQCHDTHCHYHSIITQHYLQTGCV